jgi:glycerol-3-phosphate dehydrogenase
MPGAEISQALGHTAEAVDAIPLLAQVARQERLDAPALESLAALVEGRIEPERWTATIGQWRRKGTVRAA